MPSPCCPKTPEEAGHATVEGLMRAAAAHPNLRPCPRYRGSRGTMQWIYRSLCRTCYRSAEAQEGTPDA
jgi:hypothetical protein